MSYEDIMDHPHHVSDRHPQMSMQNRAAQFSPFAALTGHSDAMRETERLTDEEKCPDPDVLELLNLRLDLLRRRIAENPVISVTFFVPDQSKSGGSYRTMNGPVRKLDDIRQMLFLADGTAIEIRNIFRIEGEIFDDFEMT